MKPITSVKQAKAEALSRLREADGLNVNEEGCRWETAYSPSTFAVGCRWHEGASFGVFNIHYPMHGRSAEVTDWISVGIARSKDPWTPVFSAWRHGDWYVDNVRYPNGAVGCVSRNYPDRKWRIVCGNHEQTFPSREAAARAERAFVLLLSGTKMGDLGLDG